jgi:hypothetical protein
MRRRQYAIADQTSRQDGRWGSIEGICGGGSSESTVCGEREVGSDRGSIRPIGLLNKKYDKIFFSCFAPRVEKNGVWKKMESGD